MQRVLIIGAAGRIGRGLRDLLPRPMRALRLMDVSPISDAAPEDEVVAASMLDLPALDAAMAGCDAVVLLAADARAWGSPPERVLRLNCDGVFNVYDAARRAGVRRVVFASSHHAVGEYPIAQPVPTTLPPRPDGLYGATKAFGESLGQMHADLHGMTAVSIRIGWYRPQVDRMRQLVIWISPRDMAQLVHRALVADVTGHVITYGYSGNSANPTRDPAWQVLGYEPQDDAEQHRAALMQRPDREGAFPAGPGLGGRELNGIRME
jgi:uronate dehydrogenase